MNITLHPIGYVSNTRKTVEDDGWGGVVSVIELLPPFTVEALLEIETFSHAEILFYFHRVEDVKIETGARHPRNDESLPKVGIFAQRGKSRPNQLGASMVKILRCEKTRLFVQGLDAIDGTPVLDIKPVMREFLPREPVQQPQWATDLMKNYWHDTKIPDRMISQLELRRSTGERGTRKWIARDGIVYDVTDCPKWRGDLHENMHFPGQDLSAELAQAPHGGEVFLHPCVVAVGRLEHE